MRISGFLTAAVVVVLLSACQSRPAPAPHSGPPECPSPDDPCDVSLIRLIAQPNIYDGRRVRVIGFVNFEFEGNAIYVSKEDWTQEIFRNGLWIDPPPNARIDSEGASGVPNRRYVIVEGTFNAKVGGHLGMWSGTLEKVTRVDPWK